MSPIIPSPLTFGESRFGLATTLIELNSLKKVRGSSQQDLSIVFTFILGFGDQLQT